MFLASKMASSVSTQPFDPSPYIAIKNSLRSSHGREFARNGWKGPEPIFRRLAAETAMSADEIPCILKILYVGCKIIEITPEFIIFDMLCGDKKFFSKNGPTQDYFEYGE